MKLQPSIEIGIIKKERIDFRMTGTFSSSQIAQSSFNQGEAFVDGDLIAIKTDENSFYFDKEVVFTPNDLNSCHFEIKEVVIGVDFHWEQKEDQKFQGTLKLMLVDNQIQVVNVLPIENYLVSVISSEMSASSSLNLLKAHAIISRSWLLAQIQKQKDLVASETAYQLIHQTETEYIRWYDREDHDLFHVCADDHCQRYQGITKAKNPNVAKAVLETAGEVLMYNHKICDARFSKSCGGVAELFENCWEPINHPYLTAVVDNPEPPIGYNLKLDVEENAHAFINGNPDAFCNTRDEKILGQVLNHYDQSTHGFFRWKVEYSQNALSALILKKSGFDFGQIMDLMPIQRGASGRLTKLKIVGTKKTITVGKELEIRRWLSESHLYSSAFTVEKTEINNSIPEKFILHGAGWGHGVGLCQIGAAVMGEKGYSHADILMHYYKNAEIVKRY